MTVPEAHTSPTEDLRALAWGSLTTLMGELSTLEATMEPTRRVSDLRVINDEEKRQLDDMIRQERRDRLVALKEYRVEATGHIAAPARMRSVDAMAEAHGRLTHLERRLFAEARVCPLGVTTDTRPTRDVSRRIRDWLHQARSAELLAAIASDADDLVEVVKRAIDGEKTTRLNAPCPYCGRRTLVVYHEQGVIRCDRPVWAECLCGAEGCPCTRGRRHVWRKERGHWDILARMLERRGS